MSQPSAILNIQIWISEPRKCTEKAMPAQQPLSCLHSLLEHQGAWGNVNRCRVMTPDSWGAYGRNDFSKPRLKRISIHRKVINFLIWDTWFSLIKNKLLMFWLHASCCKLLYNLTPPLPPLTSSLTATWDVVFCLWSLKNSHWIKHNFQLWGCVYFFSPQILLLSLFGD